MMFLSDLRVWDSDDDFDGWKSKPPDLCPIAAFKRKFARCFSKDIESVHLQICACLPTINFASLEALAARALIDQVRTQCRELKLNPAVCPQTLSEVRLYILERLTQYELKFNNTSSTHKLRRKFSTTSLTQKLKRKLSNKRNPDEVKAEIETLDSPALLEHELCRILFSDSHTFYEGCAAMLSSYELFWSRQNLPLIPLGQTWCDSRFFHHLFLEGGNFIRYTRDILLRMQKEEGATAEGWKAELVKALSRYYPSAPINCPNAVLLLMLMGLVIATSKCYVKSASVAEIRARRCAERQPFSTRCGDLQKTFEHCVS
eukprot:Blabericola_migrator_1__5001@NODE_259_length_10733_cov_186_924620_g217_i0_p5_GENE_NODE_259_length_10733_cov_186_924620_g217_i0NODE_259_length_10733_cov_186_924620_g217_i0_p5_ORF_typecomplete_len317_score23_32_NODE_259_length_10733_cov_186_924620_g217_i0905610006